MLASPPPYTFAINRQDSNAIVHIITSGVRLDLNIKIYIFEYFVQLIDCKQKLTQL